MSVTLKNYTKLLLILLALMPTMVCAQLERMTNGVILNSGTARLRVEFIYPSVVRTRFVPKGDFKDNGTDICVPRTSQKIDFSIKQANGKIELKSAFLHVEIIETSGTVSYYDSRGRLLFSENPTLPRIAEATPITEVKYNDAAAKIEKTANGDQLSANVAKRLVIGQAWKMREQMTWQPDEALYGLGSHEEGNMNLRGKRQYIYPHNLKKSMPVLMSSKGYGLLFDAGCAMIFDSSNNDGYMELEAANQLDFYFMYGPEMDQIVHQYRILTGKVELPPRYAFGYIQSKERYKDVHDIDSVAVRFRQQHIPLDVIVQDWHYWKENTWGYKKFDEKIFPEPEKMIGRFHDQHLHYMLSIWPATADNETRDMGAKGFILGRGTYDAFIPAARKMYWDEYVGKNLFSKGVDAWWLDSSEPTGADWNEGANSIAVDPAVRFQRNVASLSDLMGPLRVSLYPLHHVMGIYENQRKTDCSKRVFILTRASWPGQQRYGAMVWNGDTKATWADFKSWIPGGLNYMATGCPYWTIDAGAFFVQAKSLAWFRQGDFPKGTADLGYREFYVRNLQYAGWLPLLRSHGTEFAREPWEFGKPGEPFYDAIIQQINLCYRLLPYIYSTAAAVTNEDYTMTRPLVFDFRTDSRVYDIKDQFMFGRSFLICPVTDPMYYKPQNIALKDVPKSRKVYLPEGTDWYNFWTGKISKGGTTIDADAPISHIPVFVRSGSVIPMGPELEYTSEASSAPLEIRIYPGKDGKYTIYEDAGDGYQYQKGECASYTIFWNDRERRITIGQLHGSFPGMAHTRKLSLTVVRAGNGLGIANSKGILVTYTGQPLEVNI